MFNKLLIIFLIGFVTSCQTTGYFITDSNMQLPDIRKSVNVVLGKPRQVSLNGRELISEFHNSKFLPLDDQIKNPDRYQTKVVVLGTRRPYDINVVVNFERFENETQNYVLQEPDEELSRQRAILIKKTLNLGLDKKSGFDGDKPF